MFAELKELFSSNCHGMAVLMCVQKKMVISRNKKC
jgi:hypothetical protein